jgi:hypothetical protein
MASESRALKPVVEESSPDVVPFSGPDARLVSSTERFVSDFTSLMPVADALYKGNFAPSGCKHPSDVAMVLLTGTELGLSHAQSLRMMYMISGKPVLAADAMAAVVKRFCAQKGGGFIRVVENTDALCTVEYQRHDDPEVRTVTWTLDDAKRAGLLGNATWTKYPADMCKARALTRAARSGWPDVLGGVYDADELMNPLYPDPQPVRRTASSATVVQEAPAPAIAAPIASDDDPVDANALAQVREKAAERGIIDQEFDLVAWYRFDVETAGELTTGQARELFRELKKATDEDISALGWEARRAMNARLDAEIAAEESERAQQIDR